MNLSPWAKVVAAAALVLLGVYAVRHLPREKVPPRITSRAASITPRGASAFEPMLSPVDSDLTGAWSNGASVWVAGTRGVILRYEPAGDSFVGESSGTELDLAAVAGDRARVAVVGEKGFVATRPVNTPTWTSASTGASDDLRGVMVDTDGIVAVGVHGRVVREAAGSWSATTIDPSIDLYAVARDGAGYVAVGARGAIASAPAPGGPWRVVQPPSKSAEDDLFALAILGRDAWVMGSAGTLLRRDDKGRWNRQPKPASGRFRATAGGAGATFALTDDGLVLRLTDGRWIVDSASRVNDARGIVVRFDSLWVVGGAGQIATRRMF